MKNSLMSKRIILLLIPFSLLFTACSSGSNEVESANKKVCEDILSFMKDSAYGEATPRTLLIAVNKIAEYKPGQVADWITYVSPSDGDYVPSLYDNDNSLYQSLYRLQSQALDFLESFNAGRYYSEWRYFQKECGVEE